MADTSKITKIVSVFLNGKRLAIKSAEYTPSKTPNEAVPGLAAGEILGFSQGESQPAKVDCTLAHTDGLSMQEYKSVADATISMQTNGGKTYTMGQASYMDHEQLSGSEWKVTFASLRDAEQAGA